MRSAAAIRLYHDECVGIGAGVFDEHCELIASEARYRVASAGGVQQSVREGREQLVTDAMSLTVVHSLELVHVEKQHRDAAARALRRRERVFDAVMEEHSVGQPGQRVVQCLVRELGFEGLA